MRIVGISAYSKFSALYFFFRYYSYGENVDSRISDFTSIRLNMSEQVRYHTLVTVVGEPEIQKLEKSGRKVAEF